MTAKSRDIYSRVNQPGWNWAPALHKVNAIKSCSAPSLKPFSVPVQLLLQLALVNNNRQEHKMSLKLQQLAEDQRKLSTNGSIGSFLPTGKRNTSWCALNTYTLYTPKSPSICCMQSPEAQNPTLTPTSKLADPTKGIPTQHSVFNPSLPNQGWMKSKQIISGQKIIWKESSCRDLSKSATGAPRDGPSPTACKNFIPHTFLASVTTKSHQKAEVAIQPPREQGWEW